MRSIVSLAVALATGLPAAAVHAAEPAPWNAHPALKRSEVSKVYRQQWLRAPSRRQCGLLALATRDPAHYPDAKSRKANFSGGWGVAYDLVSQRGMYFRSAYGVANAGTSSDKVMPWGEKMRYRDGSLVSYGREGGNPAGKWLAYLYLPNGCFYNIWSGIGEDHLLEMIQGLRKVK